MLSPEDRRVAGSLKQRLREIAAIRSLRVYGSRARGDATLESDLDVYIELESITPALRQRISEIAWEIGFANDIVISTFAVTANQLEHGPVGANPLIRQVMREGVLIEDEELNADAADDDESNVFANILKLAADLGIPDLSEQHDHYFYGLDKR